MIRAIAACVLAAIFLIVSAHGEIDTSPHSNLLLQIEQKEAALEAAYQIDDIPAAMSIMKELDSLRSRLRTDPQIGFLAKYSLFLPFIDESKYLMQQADAVLVDVASSIRADFDRVSQNLSTVERAYESGDYAAALSKLKQAEVRVASFPALAAKSLEESIGRLKGGGGPSAAAMLENARSKFASAKTLYADAGSIIIGKELERADSEEASALISSANNMLKEAHAMVSEALGLMSRAKEQKSSELFDPILLALVIGPAALVLGLLVYLRTLVVKPGNKVQHLKEERARKQGVVGRA